MSFERLRSRLRALFERPRRWVPSIGDVAVTAGIGGILYGVAQIYLPAAWILGGLVSFLFGRLLLRVEQPRRPTT